MTCPQEGVCFCGSIFVFSVLFGGYSAFRFFALFVSFCGYFSFAFDSDGGIVRPVF